MLAAGRSRAGWLTIGTALALASCSAISIPGFGGAAPPVEPGLIRKAEPGNTERPEFFVQWKQSGLPGLTKRPAIDKSTALPEYPAAAVRNDDQGVTSVESCLTVDGRLVDTHIAQSSGSKVLDEATLAWAKTAKYTPAEFNGEPFAICGYRFDYEWRVTGGN
jgi:TonB family protein